MLCIQFRRWFAISEFRSDSDAGESDCHLNHINLGLLFCLDAHGGSLAEEETDRICRNRGEGHSEEWLSEHNRTSVSCLMETLHCLPKGLSFLFLCT